jgi:hypothetical protein
MPSRRLAAAPGCSANLSPRPSIAGRRCTAGAGLHAIEVMPRGHGDRTMSRRVVMPRRDPGPTAARVAIGVQLAQGRFGERVATTVASVAGATWAWVRGLAPERGTLRSDVVAGLPCAISSVPDGMATSVLIGVNPVHGLYACLFGPVGGGLTSSTRLMVITTTSAAALAAGSALSSVAEPERPRALFLLTLIAGAAMILAGSFKLGRYTRFVPHSVMIGFLSGVAVNIILGQLPSLFGISVSGPYALAKAWNLVGNLGETNVGSLLCGVAALVVIIALMRTRLAPFSALIALIIPSGVVAIVGSDSVKLVDDVGDIPAGLPLPSIPHLSDLSFEVIVGALSVTALVLVQGAGVSEAAPTPTDRDRTPTRTSQRRASATCSPDCFRVSRSVVRSGRPLSTWRRAPGAGGRSSRRGSGWRASSSCSRESSARS